MENLTSEPPVDPTPAMDGAQVSGEPSLACVMAAIKADTTITAAKRLHWLTSIRRIAEGIGRPPESVPARLTSLRHPVSRLNAAQMGIEQKSLTNHKSNVKAAVHYYFKGQGATIRGVALSGGWQDSMNAITAIKSKRLLSGIARYCSSRGIGPEEMSLLVVDDYFQYREATSFLETGIGRRRELSKAWNLCVDHVAGWPQRKLPLPALNPISQGPVWEAFPEGLRTDLDAYLTALSRPHRSANGKRRRSCRPATLRLTKAQVVAFARKAVELGTPIEELATFAALLAPQVAQKVFDAYWPESEPNPGAYIIGLAGQIPRYGALRWEHPRGNDRVP